MLRQPMTLLNGMTIYAIENTKSPYEWSKRSIRMSYLHRSFFQYLDGSTSRSWGLLVLLLQGKKAKRHLMIKVATGEVLKKIR